MRPDELRRQRKTMYDELQTVLHRHRELIHASPDLGCAALVQTASGLRDEFDLPFEAWAEVDGQLRVISETESDEIVVIGFGGDRGNAGLFSPGDGVGRDAIQMLDEAGHDVSALEQQFEVTRDG